MSCFSTLKGSVEGFILCTSIIDSSLLIFSLSILGEGIFLKSGHIGFHIQASILEDFFNWEWALWAYRALQKRSSN